MSWNVTIYTVIFKLGEIYWNHQAFLISFWWNISKSFFFNFLKCIVYYCNPQSFLPCRSIQGLPTPIQMMSPVDHTFPSSSLPTLPLLFYSQLLWNFNFFRPYMSEILWYFIYVWFTLINIMNSTFINIVQKDRIAFC